jgi:hypothetical protein
LMKYLQWRQSNNRTSKSEASIKTIKDGFLLTECMIGLALMILCTYCVHEVWSTFHRIIVRNELDILTATCFMCQHAASLDGTVRHIRCDIAKNAYRYGNAFYQLPPQVRFAILPGLRGPPGAPRWSPQQPVTFVKNTIACFRKGIMQSGTVYLTDVGGKCQFALSNAVGSTYYMRKYTYNNGWKRL